MIIGKTFTFESAHCLPGHEKCGKMHGHTYKLTVEVSGYRHENGMVMDYHALKAIVENEIEKFDHKCLNDVMAATPTCENLATILFRLLAPEFPEHGCHLHSVTLQEGEGGYAKRTR